jgi:hypothetical protein
MLWRGTVQGYNRLFTELVKEVKQSPRDERGSSFSCLG